MERIRLIALDMDGTLLASDHHTVPQENIDAIRMAHAAGIRVCICTGRMLEDASDFVTRLGLPCMIIAGNGTRASDGPLPGGHVLLSRALAPQDAHRVLDLLLPFGLMINGFEDGVVNTYAPENGQTYHLVERGLTKPFYGEAALRAGADRGILKFYVVNDGYAGAQEDERIIRARALLQRETPHLQITSSSPGNVEVMPSDANKGLALAFIAGRLGLASEQVMAMGDAPNDLSMLEYAYHSVAMANACQTVKDACRYRTQSNDDCGVAKMIRRVLAAR